MIAVAYSEVLQNVCGRWVSIQHPWMTQSNREGTSPIISLLLDRFVSVLGEFRASFSMNSLRKFLLTAQNCLLL